jgi:glutathione S-transferase
MITVHHLGVSQSERIVWLCEELGLPYKLHRYDPTLPNIRAYLKRIGERPAYRNARAKWDPGMSPILS